MMHALKVGLFILGVWTLIALVAAPLIGKALKRLSEIPAPTQDRIANALLPGLSAWKDDDREPRS